MATDKQISQIGLIIQEMRFLAFNFQKKLGILWLIEPCAWGKSQTSVITVTIAVKRTSGFYKIGSNWLINRQVYNFTMNEYFLNIEKAFGEIFEHSHKYVISKKKI